MRSFPSRPLLLALILLSVAFFSRRSADVPKVDPPNALRREAAPAPRDPSVRSKTVLRVDDPPSTELIDSSVRADAESEISELRAEVADLDRRYDGAFSRTLREVLADPDRSIASDSGLYRIPAKRGPEAFDPFFPDATTPASFAETWAFVMCAAILESSRNGTEVDNYLEFDERRPVRRVLFPR